MTATRTPGGEARLIWRTHAFADGGYVRTALGRDGSLILESYLADRGGPGAGGEVGYCARMVIVPPSLAGAFARGLMADVRRRAGKG